MIHTIINMLENKTLSIPTTLITVKNIGKGINWRIRIKLNAQHKMDWL